MQQLGNVELTPTRPEDLRRRGQSGAIWRGVKAGLIALVVQMVFLLLQFGLMGLVSPIVERPSGWVKVLCTLPLWIVYGLPLLFVKVMWPPIDGRDIMSRLEWGLIVLIVIFPFIVLSYSILAGCVAGYVRHRNLRHCDAVKQPSSQPQSSGPEG